MKNFLLVFALICSTSLIYGQETGIIDPDAEVTVTQEQIQSWAQPNPTDNGTIITLTFEGIGNIVPVGNYYKGTSKNYFFLMPVSTQMYSMVF